MTTQARVGHPEAHDAPGTPAAQEAAACLGQLVRTLKTCRLYDENNPTSIRFREELTRGIVELVGRHGGLRLEVGPSALVWAGQQVHAARARDDNLAGVLHRDGIRVLTVDHGIEAREVEALVDVILHVTGPSAGEEDLVTLLWDAELPHITIETVPLDGDLDEGSAGDGERGPAGAWPHQGSGGRSDAGGSSGPPSEPEASRSDDCVTHGTPGRLEQAFDQLESVVLLEIARFQSEQEASASRPVLAGILRFLADCFAGDLTAADSRDLGEFIPRVLHEALRLGDWEAAAMALQFMRRCDPEWSGDSLSQDLCAPHTITTRQAVAELDRQGDEGVASFLDLARAFGAPLTDWLMLVLAESQQRRVRRPLARTIGELLAGHAERVTPWLTDPRWYVVRNAVHILGWIGGDELADHLRPATEHPEPRVRAEVVAVLGQAAPDASRPVLLGMLDSAEPELSARILHQLSCDDDEMIAVRLLALLRDPGFRRRPDAERRALFLALASRGEPILPALEEELFASAMFARRPEPDRPAIALCIARIGTPSALAILKRGLSSKNGAIRKACLIAGASQEVSDG